MSRSFYKVFSKHPYYHYLNKYDPAFIAVKQADFNYQLGRRGNFESLVRYYSGNHMSAEEDHNWNYKTPWWFVNISYSAAWFTSGYILIILFFYLGDLGKVFNTTGYDLQTKPSPDYDYPQRYESIYITDRAIKW